MAIFDESKKTKSSGVMSSDKRKIQKVDALLRQRQKELITSLDAETEKIRNSNSQSLNTSINLLERPHSPMLRTATNKLVTAAIVFSTIAICLALPFAIFLCFAAYVMFSDDNNTIYGLFNSDRYRNGVIH